ncbi:MAG: hypothetical protein WAS35_00495 [Lactococcus raffinolactis]
MNNKIKAIKRLAYDFRTFRNFKKRILLMKNLNQSKNKQLNSYLLYRGKLFSHTI